MRVRRGWLAVALVVALGGGWQLLQGGYIHLKAMVAQTLLRDAWSRSLATGSGVPPWPWADTVPVARLRVPALGIDDIVLEGVTGEALAFGPGHLPDSARPGASGNVVVVGHRDTHFAFLRRLEPGWDIVVETLGGDRLHYRVVRREVMDSRRQRLRLPRQGAFLTLITCYPFDAVVPGGPLRFVVTAIAAESRPPRRQPSGTPARRPVTVLPQLVAALPEEGPSGARRQR